MQADTQITGMAGEFLVVGQLFKRELQASVTFGNAKSIDIFAYNPRTERTFLVSVKTLRKRNCFFLNINALSPEHTYIFVILNSPDTPEDFFIVPGKDIVADKEHFFGASAHHNSHHAVNYGPLKPYLNKWHYFKDDESNDDSM